ncbi:hypothetical protein [Vibrio agarivorans]|uniref:hypothetical protein n=1 Tax=Vibrio agarivorans TaxID=153622 RepID=UPI0022327CA2|nr:hypothetical protein [Vibrio agarivorans]
MKKTILSALVLAAVSAPSFAIVKVDVYNESKMEGDRHSKQGVEVQYAMDMGLGFGIEVDTNKAVELSTNYVWAMDNGFYLKPQMSYVFKGEKSQKTPWIDMASSAPGEDEKYTYLQLEGFDGENSDTFKAGLEGGLQFGNGFYTALRYRFDKQTDATSIKFNIAQNAKGKSAKEYSKLADSRSLIGRTDIVLGYDFGFLTLQGKGIHKAELNKDIKDAYKAVHMKDSGWGTELKATITAFDGVAPYLQLASRETTRKGFDNNEVKLGVAFSF